MERQMEIGDMYRYSIEYVAEEKSKTKRIKRMKVYTPILYMCPALERARCITERDIENTYEMYYAIDVHVLYGYVSHHGVVNKYSMDPNEDQWGDNTCVT